MASSLGQNFNSAGISFFLGLVGSNRRLAVPHLDVPDIRWVNWGKLKSAGFRGVVFDKDNTLTLPYALEVHGPLAPSLQDCLETFEGAVALYSNSAGLEQFDPEGEEARQVEDALGVPVLRHKDKKPGGGAEDLERHFGCEAGKLVMVGDRYLTDVAFGGKNGMLTVRCAPLTAEGEPTTVRMARVLEEQLVQKATAWGTQPPEHALLASPSAVEEFISDPGIW